MRCIEGVVISKGLGVYYDWRELDVDAVSLSLPFTLPLCFSHSTFSAVAKKMGEKSVKSSMKQAFKKARYMCSSEVADALEYVKEQTAALKELEQIPEGDDRYRL